MNRRGMRPVGLGLAVLVASLASFVPVASGGGLLEPQPPDYLIEIVRGEPIYDLLIPEPPADTDAVRFEVDGYTVLTDEFPPYGDQIDTRRFERFGVSLDTVHDFTIKAVPFFGGETAGTTLAEYHLLIDRLQVIPRVHVFPLVVKGRTHLVGFQLRGAPRDLTVRAWGRGFRGTRANYPLRMSRVKAGASSRTYLIPGGLDWRRGARPHLTFSIVPPFGDFARRGRIFTGVLKTDRAGDTSIHHIDAWDVCAKELMDGHRPPRKASCIYY